MSRPGPAAYAITALIVAAGAASAVDTDLATGPNDARASLEVASKHYDQGVIWVDDATAHYGISGRLYGFGLALDGWTAIGEDTEARPAKVGGLETTQLQARLDYLLEVDFMAGVPMLQILPHWIGILYPNQKPSPINNDQNYLGADVWFQPPVQGFEGLEFGGGMDFNADRKLRSFRGFGGARQFFQAAPFDFALHEVVTFGNNAYWQHLSGREDSQIGVLELGAKMTTPLPWREWWTFVKADGYYWLDGDQRTLNRDNGIDNGGFIIAVGIQWQLEQRR
jgi:hypothetical protein